MKNTTDGLMNRPLQHLMKLRSTCMDCYSNTPANKRVNLDKNKEDREKRLKRAFELQRQDLEKMTKNDRKDPKVRTP